MKKTIQALAVAALATHLAGTASASVFNVPSGDTKPTTARALVHKPGGEGHMLVFPYFTAQDGHATLISVTNTDVNNVSEHGRYRGKAVKVRFRGGLNADSVMDFQVLLSPGDTWTAQVAKGADGRAVLTTTDKTCTLPADVNGGFSVNRLPGTAAEKAVGTLEGYVEVIAMADIPMAPINPQSGAYIEGASQNPLYTAVKHVNGVAPCTPAALAPLASDAANLAELRGKGLDAPTGTLMGSWIIINVPTAAAYSGKADAILAVTETGEPAVGNAVFFPQTSALVANANPHTADPVLRNNLGPADEHVFSSLESGNAGARTDYTPGAGLALPIVSPAMSDLPDLSTPYIETSAHGLVTAVTQASALSEALAVTELKNEFINDASIGGGADWLLTLPTRRYSVGLDHRTATQVLVYTDLTPSANTQLNKDYFTSGNTVRSSNSFNSTSSNGVCTVAQYITLYDREERTPAGGGFVITGSAPPSPLLCGTSNTWRFKRQTQQDSVLGSKIAPWAVAGSSSEIFPYDSGWAVTRTPGLGWGMPILGMAFIKASSPAAHFGATFPHTRTR